LENRRNYYRLLNVQPDAPAEVIKASRRTLMEKLKYHPDLGGTHKMAMLVDAAYQTLTDPLKRAEYDRHLFAEQSKKSVSNGFFKAGATIYNGHADKTSIQPQRNGTPEEKDHRKTGRINQNGAISYSFNPAGYRYSGVMVDLSSDGMRFIAEEKLEASTAIEIQSPLLSGNATVKHCFKAWRNNSRVFLIGVCFKTVEFDRPRGTFPDLKA
jgi:curved DNA-binding protein CbpA